MTANTNFFKTAKIILNVIPDIFRDFLTVIHPPHTPMILQTKLLNKAQKYTVQNISQLGSYRECDTSLLYIIIRNLYPFPPLNGWAREVDPADISVAADIERLRLYRNHLYGHAHNSLINDADYNKFINEVKPVVARFDMCHNGAYQQLANAGTYTDRIDTILEEAIDIETKKMVTDLITKLDSIDQEVGTIKEMLAEPPVPELIDLIHEYKDYLRDQPRNDNLISRTFQGRSYPEKEIQSHNVVFIKGEAGIGKSQYVQQLKRSWLMQTDDNTPMLFYDCKRLNKSHKVESNVAPLYFSTMWEVVGAGKTSKDFNSMTLAGPYNEFIIVIDAIDELSMEKCFGHDCRDRLKYNVKNQDKMSGIETIFSIIYGITFPEAKLIVLGRQHEIENLDQMKDDDGSAMFPSNRRKMMKLTPFNGENVKMLTCKEVCTDQQTHDGNHEKCKKIYNRFKHVDFKKIPAYAFCLIKCFQNEASTNMGDITKTKLFMSMTIKILDDKSPDDFKACINVLAELSYNALFDELTIRTSRHCVKGDHIRFGNMELNRKICERMNLFYIREDGDYITVEPYHLTFLEFLASCYLVKHPRKWNLLPNMKKDRQLLIIPFVAGLTSNDDFSNRFISEILNCDNNPQFIKWLFDLDETNINKLPGNEYDECGDPKLWYGLKSGEIMPSFKLLDKINTECRLTTDHMPETVVKHNPQSSDEYYSMNGLVQLSLFAKKIQEPKTIVTFCEAFPGIRVEFKGNLFVENDAAVDRYADICQIVNVSLDEIDDIRCSDDVSEEKVL